MKYLIAAQRLPHKNAAMEKHYYTGRWAPPRLSENLKSVPGISLYLASAKAFDTWEDAYMAREEIASATKEMHNIELVRGFANAEFRVYGVEDKELFEARLKG